MSKLSRLPSIFLCIVLLIFGCNLEKIETEKNSFVKIFGGSANSESGFAIQEMDNGNLLVGINIYGLNGPTNYGSINLEQFDGAGNYNGFPKTIPNSVSGAGMLYKNGLIMLTGSYESGDNQGELLSVSLNNDLTVLKETRYIDVDCGSGSIKYNANASNLAFTNDAG